MRTAVVVFCILVLAAGAPDEEARITDLRITLEGHQVLASFQLLDAFDQRLAGRLDSGLPTSILYRLELHRDRKRWYDRRLRDTTLEVVAVYDAVARSYNVHYRLQGELIESRTIRDRREVEEAMTRIGPLPVFNLEGLAAGRRERLLVKVQAELGARTFLSFIPVTIATDWAESAKFHPPGS